MNNKKHNKVLDFKLYRQLLRINLPINLLFFCILTLISVLLPIGNGISCISNEAMGILSDLQTINYINSLDHYTLVYTIYIPILTLYTFSYMTKRNASDYFHSFPYTRTCLFVTNLSTIITSLIFLLTVNTSATIIIYKLFSRYYIVDIPNLLGYTVSIFICSLLVTAAILISCSITGTIFTNIIVTGIILFLPRLMITALCEFITGYNPMLISDNLHPILNYDINLVYSTVFTLKGFFNVNHLSYTANIYTFILAFIYFIISFFLFKIRKSETAGTPSSSTKIQSIIRITIALPFSLICVNQLIEKILAPHESEMIVTIFAVFSGYIMTFIVMTVYELASSKKFRNVIKCIPSLALVIIIDIALIFTVKTLYTNMSNYTPVTDEIEYVMFEYENSYTTYFDYKMKNSEITDKEIIDLVVNAYNETKKNTNLIYNYNMITLDVKFKSGSHEKNRRIAMKTTDYDKLNSMIAVSDEMIENFRKLPELNSSMTICITQNMLDSTDTELIYETLKEELKTVDKEYFFKSNIATYEDLCLNIFMPYSYDDIDLYIPINNYTPKTLQQLLYAVNKDAATHNVSKLVDIIDTTLATNSFETSEPVQFSMTLSYYDPITMEYYDYNELNSMNYEDDNYKLTENEIQIFTEARNAISNPPEIKLEDITEDKVLISVNAYYNDYSSNEGTYEEKNIYHSVFFITDKPEVESE